MWKTVLDPSEREKYPNYTAKQYLNETETKEHETFHFFRPLH